MWKNYILNDRGGGVVVVKSPLKTGYVTKYQSAGISYLGEEVGIKHLLT